MQLNIIVTLIIPVVALILSTDIEELSKNIDKHLSLNDGCIDGIRQGRERVEYFVVVFASGETNATKSREFDFLDSVAVVVINVGMVRGVFSVSDDEVSSDSFASVKSVFVFRYYILPIFAAWVVDVGAHNFVFRCIVVSEEVEIVAYFFDEILFVFVVVGDEGEIVFG